MHKAAPQVLESALLFNTSISNTSFSVRKDRLLYPNQTVSDYFVLNTSKHSVAVIATTENDEIIVTHEYRHPTSKFLLGCPGGLVDPGEDYLEAAERELLEETGCRAARYTLLGKCYPLPGVLEQEMAVVHAQDVRKEKQAHLESGELIEMELFSIDMLKQAIVSGHDVDAILCSAFLFFLLKRS